MNFLKKFVQSLQARLHGYYTYFASHLSRRFPMTSDTRLLLGFYMVVWGFSNFLMHHSFLYETVDLQTQWTPGFVTSKITYNAPIITYVMLIAGILGIVCFNRLLNYLPSLCGVALRIINPLLTPLFIFALAGLCSLAPYLSKICFVFALLILLPDLLLFVRLQQKERVSVESQSMCIIRRRILPLLLMIPVLCSLALAVESWYPVKAPNDYFEITDTFNVTIANKVGGELQIKEATRPEVINCLELQTRRIAATKAGNTAEIDAAQKYYNDLSAVPPLTTPSVSEPEPAHPGDAPVLVGPPSPQPGMDLPKCKLNIPPQELNRLRKIMTTSGDWQVEPGRLFYHQSYIFDPAIHYLKYGLGVPFPYLYGIGNTLFHAELMRFTEPTLTAYFNTFPIAQLVGIVALSITLLYISRSFLATIAGTALMLTLLYKIGFTAIFMPPGFNPLRYLGLLLQIASIFALFRGTSYLRPLLLLLSITFSFFWNTEFAMIGYVGQVVALFAPQWRIKLWPRFTLLGLSLLLVALSMAAIKYISSGYIATMHLVLFGLLPALNALHFIPICLFVMAFFAALAYATHKFEEGEAAARRCLIPIFALLFTKFLYTVSPVHLFFSLMIIAPMSLLYWNWAPKANVPITNGDPYRYWNLLFAAGFSFICLAQSLLYTSDSLHFADLMIRPFVSKPWTNLGESFPITTPEEPILTRVEALRAEQKPEDTVLLLSPFDHLLAFYAPAKRYCGHFELITNLVTYQQVRDTVSCARTAPDVLIVYDDALDVNCPSGWQSKYFNAKVCSARSLMKQTDSSIFKSLGGDVTRIKKVGSLTFYRMTPKP